MIDLRPHGATELADDNVSLDELDVLHRALAELNANDQEILLLAGPYDMAAQEIALALEITPNAAGVRLHRARSRLRGACDRQVLDAGAVR